MSLLVKFRLFDYREKRIHEERNVDFDGKDVNGKVLVEAVAQKLDTPSSDIGKKVLLVLLFLFCHKTF